MEFDLAPESACSVFTGPSWTVMMLTGIYHLKNELTGLLYPPFKLVIDSLPSVPGVHRVLDRLVFLLSSHMLPTDTIVQTPNRFRTGWLLSMTRRAGQNYCFCKFDFLLLTLEGIPRNPKESQGIPRKHCACACDSEFGASNLSVAKLFFDYLFWFCSTESLSTNYYLAKSI